MEACSGLIETVLLGVPPVPVRVTVCRVDELLSLNVMYPVRVPVQDGLNVTLMVQLAAAASEVPQVFVCA